MSLKPLTKIVSVLMIVKMRRNWEKVMRHHLNLADEMKSKENNSRPPIKTILHKEKPKVREIGVENNTAPFPSALEKSASFPFEKKGPYSEDMWETFKQVKINLPLFDAIKQIPAYAKFLKDLCTQKRKLKSSLPKKIELIEHLSAVISNSLPPTFKIQEHL